MGEILSDKKITKKTLLKNKYIISFFMPHNSKTEPWYENKITIIHFSLEDDNKLCVRLKYTAQQQPRVVGFCNTTSFKIVGKPVIYFEMTKLMKSQ